MEKHNITPQSHRGRERKEGILCTVSTNVQHKVGKSLLLLKFKDKERFNTRQNDTFTTLSTYISFGEVKEIKRTGAEMLRQIMKWNGLLWIINAGKWITL